MCHSSLSEFHKKTKPGKKTTKTTKSNNRKNPTDYSQETSGFRTHFYTHMQSRIRLLGNYVYIMEHSSTFSLKILGHQREPQKLEECVLQSLSKNHQTTKPKPFLYNSLQKISRWRKWSLNLTKKNQQKKKALRQHFSLS